MRHSIQSIHNSRIWLGYTRSLYFGYLSNSCEKKNSVPHSIQYLHIEFRFIYDKLKGDCILLLSAPNMWSWLPLQLYRCRCWLDVLVNLSFFTYFFLIAFMYFYSFSVAKRYSLCLQYSICSLVLFFGFKFSWLARRYSFGATVLLPFETKWKKGSSNPVHTNCVCAWLLIFCRLFGPKKLPLFFFSLTHKHRCKCYLLLCLFRLPLVPISISIEWAVSF